MSKDFIKKNIKLSLEFDRFVLRKPEAADKIPRGAFVVLTVDGDSAFNKSSLAMAEAVKGQRKKIIEARKAEAGWILRPLAVA